LLVDVLYDQRVNLFLSAEAAPDQLLVGDRDAGEAQLQAMIFQFDRTASRLAEMQTQEYLDQPRGGGRYEGMDPSLSLSPGAPPT
jgi:cell division protein ZapE